LTTLFVSDLHLESSRPEIGEQFIKFLMDEAVDADALFILGDLFESWIGDDDPNPHYAKIKNELSALVKNGLPVFFMHGNRDFMIGDRFSMETGIQLLPDPFVASVYGQDVMLSHGDAYCTDDTQYQAIRTMTRNPEWQAMMLQKSLAERQAFAAKAREDSKAHGDSINEQISDVNLGAIEEAIRSHKVSIMLHGHTHRPAIHAHSIDGAEAKRIVLGDWYEQGSVVRWDDDGPELCVLERP
jgi:UDP-2,3-diacylglucosamine hydrolase